MNSAEIIFNIYLSLYIFGDYIEFAFAYFSRTKKDNFFQILGLDNKDTITIENRTSDRFCLYRKGAFFFFEKTEKKQKSPPFLCRLKIYQLQNGQRKKIFRLNFTVCSYNVHREIKSIQKIHRSGKKNKFDFLYQQVEGTSNHFLITCEEKEYPTIFGRFYDKKIRENIRKASEDKEKERKRVNPPNQNFQYDFWIINNAIIDNNNNNNNNVFIDNNDIINNINNNNNNNNNNGINNLNNNICNHNYNNNNNIELINNNINIDNNDDEDINIIDYEENNANMEDIFFDYDNNYQYDYPREDFQYGEYIEENYGAVDINFINFENNYYENNYEDIINFTENNANKDENNNIININDDNNNNNNNNNDINNGEENDMKSDLDYFFH